MRLARGKNMSRTIARSITPFLVMDILEKAQMPERFGHKVIHLEIGHAKAETISGKQIGLAFRLFR